MEGTLVSFTVGYKNINEGNISNTQEDPMILASSYLTYKIGEILKQFYIPTLVTVGVAGNFLSFLVMIQPRNRHMSFSLYISLLSVADTVVLLGASVSYVEQVLDVEMPPNQRWYCRIQQLTLYSSFMWSCYLLNAMTFERFYSIIRPHKAASLNTVKKARIIIICVFVFGFLYSVPYLFITDNSGKLCVPNRFASDNGFGELYYWLTEILIFIFPCLSLLAMNSVIIHTLRTRSKQKLTESAPEGQTEGQQVKRKQSEKQIVTMLLVITFVFVALNVTTRSLVFYLTFYSSNTPYYYAGLHLFYQIGEKAFYTNHGINFFLYVMSGQKFRTDLKELFISKVSVKNETTLST